MIPAVEPYASAVMQWHHSVSTGPENKSLQECLMMVEPQKNGYRRGSGELICEA